MSTHSKTLRNSLTVPAITFIALNAIVWWFLYSAGRSSLDTYGDMAEAYAWGINWQWGYDKHPPLSAWTAAAWFHIFPTTDWAYYLLAVSNQAVAFWFLFLAGRRWLPAPQALLAVMLTSLIPLFGPDTGFKFNANSAMLPWVALFSYSTISVFQRRSRFFTILAGVSAGLACLVKYWAPLVLISIFFGSLLITQEDQNKSRGFVSHKMVVIAGLAAMLFAPHLFWAVIHNWPGLRYAHQAHPVTQSLWGTLINVTDNILLVMLIPLSAWLISIAYVRFSRAPAALASEITVPKPRIHPLTGASIFAATLFLTVISAIAAGVEVAPKWLIPAWLFFGWALCIRLPKQIEPKQLLTPLMCLIGSYWLTLFCYVTIGNPTLAVTRDQHNQRHEVARQVSRKFRELFGTPLRFVTGDDAITFSASFYSGDHPVAIPKLNFARATWVNEKDVRKSGLVVLCEEAGETCVQEAYNEFGMPHLKQVWSGRNELGEPTTVHELFYAPH